VQMKWSWIMISVSPNILRVAANQFPEKYDLCIEDKIGKMAPPIPYVAHP